MVPRKVVAEWFKRQEKILNALLGHETQELGNYAWYVGNSGGITHPVEQKLGNPWGLMDMHGNVFEWCQDFAGSYPGGSVTDPQGPPTGPSHVLRGGGFSYSAANCRSAFRGIIQPGNPYDIFGFRIVLAPTQ